MVRDSVTRELLKLENVVGIGERDGQVVVFVTEKIPEEELDDQDVVPQVVSADGSSFVQTDVKGVGKPEALSRKEKVRPAPAGVSGGHGDITTGTCPGTPPLIPVNEDNPRVFLTNAHVAAPGSVEMGDDVIQPGTIDDGSEEDVIGDVVDWTEFDEDGWNRTDTAIIAEFQDRVKDNEIVDIGPLHSLEVAEFEEGREVCKSGRTTGLTFGKWLETGVTIRVYGYGDAPLTFTDVDAFSGMSDGGDSGSLIGYFNEEGQFIGTHLLFAGSPHRTFGIPMENIFDEFMELEVPSPPEEDDDDVGGKRGFCKQVLECLKGGA